MKKIIPFKKQMTFKTNVNEITSISLENTLHNINDTVEGDLIINGTYKITEASTQVDEFEFKVPINIEIDKKYKTNNMTIDINDFYYEVINNSVLEVNIEILLDNIIENITKEELTIEQANTQELIQPKSEIKQEEIEDRCIEPETPEPELEKTKPYVKKIFENFNEDSEEYSTYHVYIVREGDSIDTILSKYNITKEIIGEYNDIDELKLGDKIIIPE